jgi:diguanylate cyclase
LPEPSFRMGNTAAVGTESLQARQSRLRRRALQMLGLIAGSYAVDTLTIALFAWAQTIPVYVLFMYGLAALATNGIYFLLFWTGYSLRFSDPNLTHWQMAAAISIQLVCMALAPNLAFLFLSVLFIIFTFGTLRLTQRAALIATALALGGIATVMWFVWRRIEIPHANAVEAMLVGFCYCTTLMRCMGVGLYGGSMRVQLHKKNKQLTVFSEQITRLANYDELTGILNRRSIWLLIEEQIRPERQGREESVFVALLDLDHFKFINDRFGHGVGDEVLRLFSEMIQALLRKEDVFGRYGGEEFLLLLRASSMQQAQAIVERIRTSIAEGEWHQVAPDLQVTVSVGIAAFRAGESIRELISRADVGLYEAKRGGRNRVVPVDSVD